MEPKTPYLDKFAQGKLEVYRTGAETGNRPEFLVHLWFILCPLPMPIEDAIMAHTGGPNGRHSNYS